MQCNSIPSAGGAAGEFPFCRERSVFCVNDMRQPVNNSLCKSGTRPTGEFNLSTHCVFWASGGDPTGCGREATCYVVCFMKVV